MIKATKPRHMVQQKRNGQKGKKDLPEETETQQKSKERLGVKAEHTWEGSRATVQRNLWAMLRIWSYPKGDGNVFKHFKFERHDLICL